MLIHNQSIEEILRRTNSTRSGLSSVEAKRRLEKNGSNQLKAAKKQNLFKKILLQILNPMFLLLLCAGFISLAMWTFSGSHRKITELFEALVIFFIVFINIFVGLLQEGKAEKALESLSKMSEPFCKVLRDGVLCKIKTSEVVIGDVVLLEAGDIVPADGRILFLSLFRVEESALTGESMAVSKQAETISKSEVALAEKKNMVFSGSIVAYGRCEFVVTAVAMDTELGKIAGILDGTKKEQTRLQKNLNQVGKFITSLVVCIAILVYIAMMFMGDTKNAFMTAVVLAVAAIPEGLPSVVTIVMSLGVSKLSKKNAIIKRLTAVETLGCTQIICTDKTGTLTLNKMTVTDVVTASSILSNKATDDEQVLLAMTLCNDSKKGADNTFIGDPTETALLNYTMKKDMDKAELDAVYSRIGEVPFDSARKMMSVVVDSKSCITLYAKGAIDVLLNKCSYILLDKKIVPLNELHKQKIRREADKMSSQALRVLSYAQKTLSHEAISYDKEECELVFLGLSAMIDPPRPEVKQAIEDCKQAGIKVVMITGDHKNTAVAIGKQIGLDGGVLTGQELDKLSDKEFEQVIFDICIYARVSPQNKVRIVTTFKKLGKIVAMTGDGVNDAPSLKNAHIGIGMGINGTDVTKGVADMILADDNFATIKTSVKEGRKIFTNIQKAIVFLLSSNMCEVLSLFFVIIFALASGNSSLVFLAPVHLLWVNLVTDTFPSLAFSSCEADDDIMKRPPRDDNKNMLLNKNGIDILVGGLLQTAVVLIAFFVSLHLFGNVIATTVTVIVLNFIQLIHAFNVQANGSIFSTNIFKNKPLIYACLGGAILTLMIVFVPGVNDLFGLKSLNFGQAFLAISMAFCIVPLYEIYKSIRHLIYTGSK